MDLESFVGAVQRAQKRGAGDDSDDDGAADGTYGTMKGQRQQSPVVRRALQDCIACVC